MIKKALCDWAARENAVFEHAIAKIRPGIDLAKIEPYRPGVITYADKNTSLLWVGWLCRAQHSSYCWEG